MDDDMIRRQNTMDTEKRWDSLHRSCGQGFRNEWPYSRFLCLTALLIGAYALMHPFMVIHLANVHDSTFVSVPMFMVYALSAVLFAVYGGLPRQAFGMTLKGWPTALLLSAIVTATLLLLITLGHGRLSQMVHPAMNGASPVAQVGVMWSVLTQAESALLANTAAQRMEHSYWLVLVYIVFVPVQEFVIRGTFLGGLLHYRSDALSASLAIIASAIVYSLVHLYLGVVVSLMVIVPGLMWGWLFYRTRSLLAVSLSHAVCGLYALYFLDLF